jgi:hypothetical protein
MRRTPVADYGGQRQIRQAEFTPEPARDVLSAEAHEYTDPVPGQQAKYAADPVYNGADALRRLRGPHGG